MMQQPIPDSRMKTIPQSRTNWMCVNSTNPHGEVVNTSCGIIPSLSPGKSPYGEEDLLLMEKWHFKHLPRSGVGF